MTFILCHNILTRFYFRIFSTMYIIMARYFLINLNAFSFDSGGPQVRGYKMADSVNDA